MATAVFPEAVGPAMTIKVRSFMVPLFFEARGRYY